MPESPAQPTRTDEYFQHRQLRSGAAGWVLLAGLGIAYVISGDFSGWNIGLSEGGWGRRSVGAARPVPGSITRVGRIWLRTRVPLTRCSTKVGEP